MQSNRIKTGEYRTCHTCGNAFYVYPSEFHRRGNYCSNQCAGPGRSAKLKGRTRSTQHALAISQAKLGKPNWKLRKPPVIRSCEYCSHEFTVTRKGKLAKENQRFCSTDCWYEHIRQDPERHPSYRGGYDPYYGPNWTKQSKAARKRDGYTCQHCGKQQRKPALDVHHIVPRRLFNGDWESANELQNLITLCKSCHSAIPNPD